MHGGTRSLSKVVSVASFRVACWGTPAPHNDSGIEPEVGGFELFRKTPTGISDPDAFVWGLGSPLVIPRATEPPNDPPAFRIWGDTATHLS